MDQLPFRVQRIFDGLFSPRDNSQTPMSERPMPEPELQAGFDNSQVTQTGIDPIIQSLLHPKNDVNERLIEMMKQQPTHDQFKPNFGQKLVSGLISMRDPQQGQAYLNRGYNNAMQDWQGKLKPLSELADAERAQNTNSRLGGAQLLRDQQAQERVDATKRGQDIAAETADKNRAQKESFKAYLENKAMNPGDKLSEDANGLVYSFNPVTHAVTYLKGEDGGPIHSSKLPELAKAELTQKNELERISARGNESRQTAAVTGDEARKTAQTRGDVAVNTAVKTAPLKESLKRTTPGKNTSAVSKPGDESIKVISPNGTPGSIPKSQLEAAKAQGFKVVDSTAPKPKLSGIGLNLKEVKPKVGF